jgi:hypothetical protein
MYNRLTARENLWFFGTLFGMQKRARPDHRKTYSSVAACCFYDGISRLYDSALFSRFDHMLRDSILDASPRVHIFKFRVQIRLDLGENQFDHWSASNQV